MSSIQHLLSYTAAAGDKEPLLDKNVNGSAHINTAERSGSNITKNVVLPNGSGSCKT